MADSPRRSFDGAVRPDAVEWFEGADGVRLHGLRWHGGDQRPIVLLHGLASNAHLWDGVAVALAEAGHPVLSIDQRGHGRSDKPDDGYDLTTVTDDLAAVLEGSGFERPVLAGQSWGGNVVIEFAARFPGAAAGVACVDGGSIHLSRVFPDWESAAQALAPPRTAGTPAVDIERWFRSAHADWPETGIEGALACFEVRPDGTVAPWLDFDRHLLVLRGLYDHEPSTRFPEITDPVLWIPAEGGENDRGVVKRADLEAAVGALPRSRVHWMVGDHDLHAQYPGEIARLLSDASRDLFA